MYEQIKKNNVDSSNQLANSEIIKFFNKTGKGIRVMFVGNSITLHGVKEDIAWLNEWGMAASKKENDYVHRVMNVVSEKDTGASYCICQVADWEREYKCNSDVYRLYSSARDFKADIIIARFIENCSIDEFDPDIFKKEYNNLIDYLNYSTTAQIIFTSGFWKHPGNAVISEIAKDRDCPFVVLEDLGEQDDVKAIGQFWHNGVANHPGDKGMEIIADRILKEIHNIFNAK